MGISLSSARCEEIKKIVVDLFAQYGVSCVPVNGFELATKMGVKIVPYSAISEGKRWLLFKKSEDGFCLEKIEANGSSIIMTGKTMDVSTTPFFTK